MNRHAPRVLSDMYIIRFETKKNPRISFEMLAGRGFTGVYPKRRVCCLSNVRRKSESPPPKSAYVHLPFCRKRCHYCDFPIVALGSSSNASDPRISDYVSLLLREISATGGESLPPAPLETVFFGGGTPSLVPPRLVASVLDALRHAFGVAAGAEISMEMDPGTFDRAGLREFLSVGVNRVSLGVQAFQEELLVRCGRAHGVREVEEAVEMVSGEVENWSMDLISGLPGQSVENWGESLERTAVAGPKHVSVYDLQVETGTKFGRLYTPGKFPLPSEDSSADMYRMASDFLSSRGYTHYEISSYAKPGFQCRHNLTYWAKLPFYAFGLGAASYTSSARFTRPRRMKDYAAYVAALEASGGALAMPPEEATAADVVMLALRTARGLDMDGLAAEYGDDLVGRIFRAVEEYVGSGHVAGLDLEREVVPASKFRQGVAAGEVKFLRLSDPEGFLLSNELISIIFAAMST